MKKAIATVIAALALTGMTLSSFAASSPIRTESATVGSSTQTGAAQSGTTQTGTAQSAGSTQSAQEGVYMTSTGRYVEGAPEIGVTEMDTKSTEYQALGTSAVKDEIAEIAKADNQIQGDVVVQPLTAVQVKMSIGKDGAVIIPTVTNPVYVDIALTRELQKDIQDGKVFVVVMGYNEITGRWEKVSATIVNGKVVAKLIRRTKYLAVSIAVKR